MIEFVLCIAVVREIPRTIDSSGKLTICPWKCEPNANAAAAHSRTKARPLSVRTNAPSAKRVPERQALCVRIAAENLCEGRIGRLAFDSVGQKAFLADNVHVDERTVNGARQEIRIHPGQRRRLLSTKKKWRDGEIELIDQMQFQKGTE
jgi:hypothetical protein